MDASLALQYAIIAIAVVVSAWVVLKKQFPGPVRKARIALALPLLREGRADGTARSSSAWRSGLQPPWPPWR